MPSLDCASTYRVRGSNCCPRANIPNDAHLLFCLLCHLGLREIPHKSPDDGPNGDSSLSVMFGLEGQHGLLQLAMDPRRSRCTLEVGGSKL